MGKGRKGRSKVACRRAKPSLKNALFMQGSNKPSPAHASGVARVGSTASCISLPKRCTFGDDLVAPFVDVLDSFNIGQHIRYGW